MKKPRKITVKHFINTSLTSRAYVKRFTPDGKFEIPHPLYVKITFMRKTTQMKSIVNSDYTSMDEALSSNHDLRKAEIKMVEDIIKREYTKSENNFSLNGISDKCKIYHESFLDSIFNSYLWQDYNNVILKTRSKFMKLLLKRLPNISAMTYYDAAIKLLGKIPELLQLKDRFEKYQNIKTVLKKDKRLNNMRTIEWKYGQGKENFVLLALKQGSSFDKVTELVNIIDNEINKIQV